MNERGERREACAWALGLLAGLGLVVVGAVWVGDFIEDDTLISLRYAERFLEGKGLTWNDGERVEGYSNLAWVLGSAALGALGVDLILAARILAFTCWAVTFGALLLFSKRVGASWLAFGAASIALGATSSLSVWGMGALEQPLIVACLAVALWALSELVYAGEQKGLWALLIAASLYVLVWARPDSPLLVVAVAASAFFLLRRDGDTRAALSLSALVAGVPLVAWLAQLGFRLVYYGEWVPNPAHIKTHVSSARLLEGLSYVGRGLGAAWLLTALGAIGAVLALSRQGTRAFALSVLSWVVMWTAYVAVIGGDHFPAFRHLLLVQICLAALLVLGLSRWRLGDWMPFAVFAVACALVVPYVKTQRTFQDINVATRARWQWDGQAVGRMFGAGFADQAPLWAVTAAGCLPYFSRLPALDLLGLNDAHIARQRPDPELPLAHDHGDGVYVLDRAPDLVTFGLPRGQPPMYKSGREMSRDPRFSAEYQRVTFRTTEPISVLTDTYVRRAGRVGFVSEDDRLLVPAYLLREAIGHPMPTGGLGAQLVAGRNGVVRLPELPPGQYRVRSEPEVAALQVRVLARDDDPPLSGASDAGVFSIDAPASLRIEVRAPRLTTLLRSLIVERLGPPDEAAEGRHRALVLRSGKRPPESTRARPIASWAASGDAFETDADANRGRGRLISTPFPVERGAWLEFRIAGGRASDSHTQVGVRIVDLATRPPKTRLVFTGRDDDTLRRVRVDLNPLAGREARIEIFDESRVAHIQATDFALHE